MPPPTSYPLTITPLTTLPSPSQSRSWHSTPHPNPAIPLLATSTSDRTILIHNLRTHKLHSTIQGGHKRSVRSCSWRPLRRPSPLVLASGSFDATAGIWRYANSGGGTEAGTGDSDDEEVEDEGWKFEVLLEGHDSEIKSVAWNRSGRLLATCSRDKSVWVWEDINYQQGEEGEGGGGDYETIAVLQDHDGDVKCVAWHPTEDLLASGSYDDEIRLYREDEEDDDEWRCVCLLKGHESTVWCVVFEQPGKQQQQEPRLASCSADKTIRIWRRVVAQQQQQGRKNTRVQKYPSTFISREEEAEKAEHGAGEEEWEEESVLPTAHQGAVYSLAWSGRTGRIVSTGEDGRVVVYEERRRQLNGGVDRMDIDGEREGGQEKSWVIIACLEAAHGVWEVNCVCWWAGRRRRSGGGVVSGEDDDDNDGGKEGEEEEEEVLITTGDDGLVKIWSLLLPAVDDDERQRQRQQQQTARENGAAVMQPGAE